MRHIEPAVLRLADDMERKGGSLVGGLRAQYWAGATPRQMASELGTTTDVISAAIRHFGLAERAQDPSRLTWRKYQDPDVRVITDPQTDADHYWLGWLAGQSSVTRYAANVSLAARASDAPHLEALVTHLGTTTPVAVRGGTAQALVHSVPLVDALARHGITAGSQQGRTRHIPYPIRDLPADSAPRLAWLRGVWDANGGVGGNSAYITARSPRIWGALARTLGDNGVRFGSSVISSGGSGTGHIIYLSAKREHMELFSLLVYGEPSPAGPTVFLERTRTALLKLMEKNIARNGVSAPPWMRTPAPTVARSVPGSPEQPARGAVELRPGVG